MVTTLLLLTGCAATVEPPRPLSYDETLTMWTALIEPEWESIQTLYPGVARPDTTVVNIVEPDAFPDLFAECMASEAYGDYVHASDSGSESLTPLQPEPSKIAVAQFACSARYPDSQQLDGLLSAEQSAALFDYFRDFAEPCLVRLGEHPIPDPITREEFVTESTWGPAWSPFYTSGSRTADGARGDTVTALCPPEPAWLTEQRRPVD